MRKGLRTSLTFHRYPRRVVHHGVKYKWAYSIMSQKFSSARDAFPVDRCIRMSSSVPMDQQPQTVSTRIHMHMRWSFKGKGAISSIDMIT